MLNIRPDQHFFKPFFEKITLFLQFFRFSRRNISVCGDCPGNFPDVEPAFRDFCRDYLCASAASELACGGAVSEELACDDDGAGVPRQDAVPDGDDARLPAAEGAEAEVP